MYFATPAIYANRCAHVATGVADEVWERGAFRQLNTVTGAARDVAAVIGFGTRDR